MRYGIFSDVHGNLEALEAVVSFCEKNNVEQYLCLGDVVGRGASPQECLNKILDLDCLIVAGNFDYAVSGKLKTDYFGCCARQSVLWTRANILHKHLYFLSSLDLLKEIDNKMTLVHSTVIFPELFDYIQTQEDANRCLEMLDTPVCFYGHSHVPVAFKKEEMLLIEEHNVIDVVPQSKILINVGSVGQPRDCNPLASCCIYDTKMEKAWIHRIEYDIDKSAEKIIDAGLPDIHAKSLYYGR